MSTAATPALRTLGKPTPCMAQDPEMFFDPQQITQAKAVCLGCWFKTECRQIGRESGYGLFGGQWFGPKDEEEW